MLGKRYCHSHLHIKMQKFVVDLNLISILSLKCTQFISHNCFAKGTPYKNSTDPRKLYLLPFCFIIPRC